MASRGANRSRVSTRPSFLQSEGVPAVFDPGRLGPIVVVGDILYDHFVWGEVERVSPEAPVQVLRWEQEVEAPGGAANVALNLASLGCRVRLVGVVGKDAPGRRLVGRLRKKGVDTSGILTVADRPTSQKMRVIARGQHILRIDRERVHPLEPDDERRLAVSVRRLGLGASGIICSDYAKGVLGKGVLASVFGVSAVVKKKRPHKGNLFVLVDPKGRDFTKYRKADILTPNARELMEGTYEMAGRLGEGPNLDRRTRWLMGRTGVRALLVTRGAEGMDLFEAGGAKPRKTHVPVFQTHQVYDVTGAGDTVAAVMGMAVFGGAPLVDAARLANAAAGIVVGMIGTAVVELEALTRMMGGGSFASGLKLLSRDALKRRLAEARVRGERVVFTNGCFDMMHAGHLHLLQRARARGDLLVVGLNDDASIRRLKGPGRPLIDQNERAEMLASLRFVDYVSIFTEPTPLRLIRALRPDVLVKGSDYRLDEVVGRDLVKGFGGRVELIPLLPGFSTSSRVEVIRRGRR